MYHEIEVDIVGSQIFKGRGDTVLDTSVPGVVKLGGKEDLLTWHAGVLDSFTNLLLVTVGEGRVDMTVASLKSHLDGSADLRIEV